MNDLMNSPVNRETIISPDELTNAEDDLMMGNELQNQTGPSIRNPSFKIESSQRQDKMQNDSEDESDDDNLSEVKYEFGRSEAKDKDPQDKAWRVRALLKLFQKNILKFGFWNSALSVDEMMAKSYARTCLKQFIRGKPTPFGLKFWDLVVHLNRLKLKCTGTVRDNRVPVKNVIHKKAPRGTYVVKHEKNSGINYITVMDSKPVLILSTAAGVTPLSSAKRYSSIEKEKVDIPVLQAFHLYNQSMGGVDVHDGHCNNLLPSIRLKKWTWMVFVRLIQAAITNAVVIFNAVDDSKIKVGTKEFAMSIAKSYIHDA
ncbi:piggyBac transposable element-derived protein 3-like [Phymastichus coffea]|uniref:piggyBac transposable element-derived protein 3-like n=1 Tax=Phymastichus coffea TaxID=108790 RepID=UPI00273C9A68|nr:piggyBac transposable element-derived protein 3-like [Phymastichus coffea]